MLQHKKRIVLAGGSGFLGTFLGEQFQKVGYEVVVLGRGASRISNGTRFVTWDGKNLGSWINEIDGADVLVNLAGRSINCRFNSTNRSEILNSRIDSTTVLAKAIQQSKRPPALWVNSSTASLYRQAFDKPMDEWTGEIGTGFTVDVGKKWEQSFFESDLASTRRVALRISIILGKHGGAMIPLRNITKFGLGGKQAGGKQMFSWIHEMDVFEIVRFLESHPVEGAVNCTAPNPVTNAEFMREMRQVIGMPIGLPAPLFILELGTRLLRTESELIVNSHWVLPARLLQEGFKFRFANLPDALKDLCPS